MPRNRELVRSYTARALTLIRAANGLWADVDGQLRALARELAGRIAQTDLARRGELSALVREVDEAVRVRYGAVAASQSAALAELVRIEAEWARRTGAYRARPSDRAIQLAVSRILVMGSTVTETWDRSGQTLAWRIGGDLRTAAANGQAADEAVGLMRGHMSRARQGARTAVQTSSRAAAEAGRRAAWEAAGTDALMWVSVLDQSTTEGCALRHGKLYTLDLEPIDHGIPIEREPPRHWGCRSLLAPQTYGRTQPPEDGGAATFDEYLASLSQDEQDDLLGAGRAELYRRGVITQRDLVDQTGRLLTLAELRELP